MGFIKDLYFNRYGAGPANASQQDASSTQSQVVQQPEPQETEQHVADNEQRRRAAALVKDKYFYSRRNDRVPKEQSGFIKDKYFRQKEQQETEQPAADGASGAAEIPRRTHQSTGGSAMPVNNAPAAAPQQQAVPQATQQPGPVVDPAAVTSYLQGMQQRAVAQQQDKMRVDRHQYSADPMNRLFAPANARPQQSSGTVDQARPANNQPQVTNMDELTAAIERARREVDEANETPEQKAAREKREKREKLLATIGDGLGAFHEAYSHMRDIKPMTNGSIQAKQEARIRALGLERDKKYSDALQNYIKVMDMKRKNEYYNSIAETRRKQQESQDRDREEKRKEAARLNDARIELYKARQGKLIDESAYNQAYTDAIRSGLPESEAIEKGLAASKASLDELARQQKAESDAKVQKLQSDAHKSDAAANASNARAAKTRAGGSSGSTTTKTTYDKNGNVKSTVVTTKSNGNSGSRRSSSKKGNNGNKKRKSKTST